MGIMLSRAAEYVTLCTSRRYALVGVPNNWSLPYPPEPPQGQRLPEVRGPRSNEHPRFTRANVFTIALLIMLIVASCAQPELSPAQQPARPVHVLLTPFVRHAEDSLAALSAVELRERGGCLLGSVRQGPTADTVLALVLWEAPRAAATLLGISIWCPAYITVGVWHSHPPLNNTAPPTTWCVPSAVDSTSFRSWARAGVYVHHINVLPGVRCAWWAAPDGTITRMAPAKQELSP